jgi:uncharacterized protein YlzI (FlbEa/FlbD family)
MKIIFLFLIASSSAFAYSEQRDSTKKHTRTPLIRIVKYKENVMVFNDNSRKGIYGFFFPKRILGEYQIIADGLQFTPFSVSPPDIEEKQFLKQYWNDDLEIEKISLAYSSIKKVRKWYGVRITMTNGKKYLFTTNHPNKMVKELQSKLDVLK